MNEYKENHLIPGIKKTIMLLLCLAVGAPRVFALSVDDLPRSCGLVTTIYGS